VHSSPTTTTKRNSKTSSSSLCGNRDSEDDDDDDDDDASTLLLLLLLLQLPTREKEKVSTSLEVVSFLVSPLFVMFFQKKVPSHATSVRILESARMSF
jgi:hypothetical protein